MGSSDNHHLHLGREEKPKNKLALHEDGEYTVVSLPAADAWNGAVREAVREVVTDLIEQQRCRYVGINLSGVQYLPEGFFGMLGEWAEDGVHIQLHFPTKRVQSMLWFCQNFHHCYGDVFEYGECEEMT